MARIPPLTSLGREQGVTAVAALPSHLALGTTSGAVFWHNRSADSLQRLEVFPGVEVDRQQDLGIHILGDRRTKQLRQ